MSAPSSSATRIPAVLYAAKSTADEKGSIPTQIADCRAAAEAEGREVIVEHQDEAASAYKADRGPGLRAALDRAERLAQQRGVAELWVQHPDRLARGDGLRATHLIEYVLDARKVGVELRAVQHDDAFRDLIRAVLTGERNHEDSARKAAAVSSGMRRGAERGDPPGGICPDGYRVLRGVDDHGRKWHRWEKDPERWEIYRLHFDLALAGHSDREIVLELDRRGFRTRPRKVGHRPRSFDANRVRQTLANPAYAGLRTYKGDVVVEGNWSAVVSAEDFERIRAMRAHRSHGRKPTTGRPPEGYVLARVAACGACGGPMDVVTGRRVRRDGTRPRRYVCRAHRERPQDCSAKPVDAGLVDRAFVHNLTHFLGDVDAWRGALVTSREAEQARLEGEVERARADIAASEKVLGAARRRYDAALAAGDDERADTIEEAMRGQRVERTHAESRLSAALAAMEEAGEDVGVDPLLDFYNGLSAELGACPKSPLLARF